VVAPGARSSVADDVFAPHEVVCELGSRPVPAFAVRQKAGPGGKPQLLVGERFAGAGKSGDPRAADFVREARRIATLANPNLARVREVNVRGDDLAVLGEFVDGEKASTLWLGGALSLEIALRVIIDALSGLSALHNLRDTKQQPMHLAHGELSPATVLFGIDGASRVLHVVARRAPGARTEAASLGYLAPEVHSGEPFDARADVFGAGVML
jgi:eukaryotic-like serine/threonine-protein kinase